MPDDNSPVVDDSLQALRRINPELANILDQIRPHVRSDEFIEKREKQRAIVSRHARAEAGKTAFLNHLPDKFKRMAQTPLQPRPGNKEALAAAEQLKLGQNLYLWGSRGTGKTHLALKTALRMIIEEGLTAKFYPWETYLSDVMAAYKSNEHPESLVRHEILILDDIDKRVGTSNFASEQLWNVLQRLNYDETKTTIITANRSAAATATLFYGGDKDNQAAMASRLAYMMQNVHVGGKDGRAE
jgi:DNA replication protein DnaC